MKKLLVDAVSSSAKNRTWKATLAVLDSFEFTNLVINAQGIKKGMKWPEAAYATLCLLALRKAAKKARQP